MGEKDKNAGNSSSADASALERKIIYTAELNLVVEDFSPVSSEVEDLAREFGGYIAHSKVYGMPGAPRRGEWTLRVPVARYEELLVAARKIGEVRSESRDSREVTEEFYDLQARIRNKKRQEERLLKILDETAGKLKDILDVEQEIARIRGEIEQMEGRVRVLNDLTAMTTVTLNVEEVKDYVPEESPTYATRIRRAFHGSITAIVSTAQVVSILVAVITPWLGILLVIAVVPWLIFRMRRRRRP
jgi:hypothetical protein